MKDILFKIKDNKFYICVPEQLTNKEFLENFKKRTENLMILKESIKENVILSMENRSLDNREILQLFDILNEANIFYINKIICKSKSKERLSIYKESLRGGQIKFFENSILLIGNVNKGGKIIVNGDLYVLGSINGDVELKDKGNKIYCESISNSLVKIGDVYKLYTSILWDKEISCVKNQIIENDYSKGEKIYGKSDSCYIG